MTLKPSAAHDWTRPGLYLQGSETRLTVRAVALALSVALVWGTNPVAIHEGLKQFPPLGGASIRFLIVVIPLALFVPRPRIPIDRIASYGFLLGAGLGFNNIAMAGHITPGLASLLLQIQVVLTIAFELVVDRRLPRTGQIFALLLCSAGVVVIGLTEDGGTTDGRGVVLMIAAATCWAIGNLLIRRSHPVPAVAMMIWSSIFACLPLALLSVIVEGSGIIDDAIGGADIRGWSALIWQAAASSLFGYASWNFLLTRYSAGRVAPFALLVPVFGMAASAIFIGEMMTAAKIAACTLIVSGLAFALLQRKVPEPPAA